MTNTEKAVVLGGFKQFHPEYEPSGKMVYYISNGHLRFGRLERSNEKSHEWWIVDGLTGDIRYPYTSDVLLIENTTIRDTRIIIE